MCRLYVLRLYIPSGKFFKNRRNLLTFPDSRQSLKLSSFRRIILNDSLLIPQNKVVCSRLQFEPINLIEQAGPLYLRLPFLPHSHFKLVNYVSTLRVVVVDQIMQIRDWFWSSNNFSLARYAWVHWRFWLYSQKFLPFDTTHRHKYFLVYWVYGALERLHSSRIAWTVNASCAKCEQWLRQDLGFHLSVVEQELNHVALMANHKKPTQWTNKSSKQVHVICAKREKTQSIKAQLVIFTPVRTAIFRQGNCYQYGELEQG